jgi:hypothetical protein
VRAFIKRGKGDSEDEIRQGIERGTIGEVTIMVPPEKADELGDRERRTDGREELLAWRLARARFTPNQVPVWIDEAVARRFAAWLHAERGIAWTEHTAFGRRLAQLAGVKYYGRKGLADDGSFIDDESGPLVCSVRANVEGRNLQFKHSRNLVTSWSPNAKEAEQMIGRTHRDGQPEDTVTVDVYTGAIEHIAAWDTSLIRAKYIQETTGQPQKLLYADKTMPTLESLPGAGVRWST